MRKALILVVLIGLLFGGGYSVFADDGHGAPDGHMHELSCKSYCTALNVDPEREDLFPPVNTTCICNPLQSDKFTDIVNNVLTILFNFALVLTPIMVVIAGIMFVTAAGDPSRVSRAKQILIWTAVGFVVILVARGLVLVLRTIIGF